MSRDVLPIIGSLRMCWEIEGLAGTLVTVEEGLL